VTVTPDGQRAVSASRDHTLRIWDLASGSELRTLRGHTSIVNAIALTPDGRHAFSASEGATINNGENYSCSCRARHESE
jgi:WD40 repeat protein